MLKKIDEDSIFEEEEDEEEKKKIKKTYLSLDIRHKEEYIHIHNERDEKGKRKWQCMCSNRLHTWERRSRMKLHMKSKSHQYFLNTKSSASLCTAGAIKQEDDNNEDPLNVFLELDIRNKSEYITIKEEEEGRIYWSCLCVSNMRKPFHWQGRAKMEKHVEAEQHQRFLENPSKYIFDPQQLWTESGLDVTKLVLTGLNNCTAVCKDCEMEFPSTADEIRTHIKKHVPITKRERPKEEEVYMIEEDFDSYDIEKAKRKRACKLIEDGRCDEEIITSIANGKYN